MGADGKLLEYYRLSILKYARDPKTGQMSLEDRGSFCRVRIDLEDETPAGGGFTGAMAGCDDGQQVNSRPKGIGNSNQ